MESVRVVAVFMVLPPFRAVVLSGHVVVLPCDDSPAARLRWAV
ncbi:hypothetical protein [Nocardioides panacihumi]